jgi:hypothetical protein
MRVIKDILDAQEFQAGLGPALVALLAAFVLGVVWRRWRERRLPAGGLLFAGAAVVALQSQLELPNTMLVGLAALAVAGLTGDVLRWPLVVRALLAIPGALLVGSRTEVSDRRWVEAVGAITRVVGGAAASDLDLRWRRPSIGCGLFAITVGGVYATVPDTESALCILAPAAAVAVIAWPGAVLRLGSGGAFAAIGVLAWVTAFGGIGRDGSIVGGLLSLGLLVAEPLACWFSGVHSALVRHPTWRSAIGMGTAHGALVFVTARVAGFRSGAGAAAIIGGVALLVAAVACVVVGQLSRRSRQSTADSIGGSADTR